MVGTPDHFKMKLKAMETAGFMEFLIEIVNANKARVEGSAAIVQSGQCCLEYIKVIQAAGARVPAEVHQRMTDLWIQFCSLTSTWPMMRAPKTHLMFELNLNVPWFGSPWLYNCFLDESLNKLLKKLLRNCHQSNFEWLALKKAQKALRRWTDRCAYPVI